MSAIPFSTICRHSNSPLLHPHSKSSFIGKALCEEFCITKSKKQYLAVVCDHKVKLRKLCVKNVASDKKDELKEPLTEQGSSDASLFPDVDSSWKTFNEIQKLLSKTNGKIVGDLMTPSPLFVHESTSLEDAARLLLETKYHQLSVVEKDGKLVNY